MTKTLLEIQFFNRRKIYKAINGTEICFSHIEALELLTKPLTFDRVLLALLKINDNLRVKHKEEFIIELYESIWCEDCEEYELRVHFDFDLTKPTLEEQSEETQRGFYELLGGENE